MKNNTALIIVLAVFLFVILGCGSLNPFAGKGPSNQQNSERAANQSNKSLGDQAVDTAAGEQKIGVPECDEVLSLLTKYAENPNDNFIVRGGKAIVANRIKSSMRTAVERNQTDKVAMATACKEAKVELEKALAPSKQ